MYIMRKLLHLIAIATVAGALFVAPSAAHAGTIITVNTAEGTINTNGNCSLPEAVVAANNDSSTGADACPAGSGTDTIQFNIPGGSPHVIYPADEIDLSAPVIIDGTTQPDYPGTPNIVVDGNGSVPSGLVFLGSSPGSAVKGLMVRRFAFTQIRIGVGNATSHVTLTGNYIGTDGTAALGGNYGVFINEGQYAVVGGPNSADRNVISGNSANVWIEDGDYNTVQGNYIGLNAAGTASVTGSSYGVFLSRDTTGASNNTVMGNVISGNSSTGIYIHGAGNDNNLIESNYIGTNAAGTAAVSPASVGGIAITGGANNVVGGTAPGAGNVVSGNSYGISVYAPASGTKILGNRVGTDKNGTAAIPNPQAGIYIGDTAVAVGDATTAGNNLVSGNTGVSTAGSGIAINGSASAGTTVMGNKIGISLSGGSLPNTTGINVYSSGSARIAQNWIANNASGSIYVDPTASVASGSSLNSGNCFISNGTSGLLYLGVGLADFRGNWWGAADGPSGSGTGSGDVIWGVDYIPFLTAAAAACQPTISGNAGAGGATLTYTGGSTIADSHGDYSIAVASGWSGTVTPSKAYFTFSPTNKVYSGVTSDQTGQDYTATLTPPTPIVWVRPIHGSQACPAPQVGLDLLLMGITPSPWTLKLDGGDVTGASMMWELLMNPPRAITMYTPTTDLALGVHAVEFDYATPAGPQVLTWNFTVVDTLPCPTDTGSTLAPEPGEAPSYSSPDVSSADRRVIDIP